MARSKNYWELGWVPFFLILLVYHVKLSETADRNLKTTTTTASTTVRKHTNINENSAAMLHLFPKLAEQTSYEYANVKTLGIPASRDKRALRGAQHNDQVFLREPDGGVPPVSLPGTEGSVGLKTNFHVTPALPPLPVWIEEDSGESVIPPKPDFNEKQLHYLTNYIQQTRGMTINFSKLLTLYTQVCPVSSDSPCNFLTPEIQSFQSTFENEFECPYFCSCDNYCVGSGNCCPGSIYAYTDQDCVNTQLYPSDEKKNYHMISTCPSTFSNQTVVDQCEGHLKGVNQSNLQPVTSRDTFFTYKNRFCSICHGEKNITDWQLRVTCPSDNQFEDNFESFAEMKKVIDQHKCRIAYDLGDSKMVPSGCTNPTYDTNVRMNIVAECNKTGLWLKEDHDIRWACEHFNGRRYQNFKNIFCFLCNPSMMSTNMPLMIDRCNITENWDVFDPVLETACLQQPAISRLFPYKNVYCLICNGVNTLSRYWRNLYRTDDMEIEVDESFEYEHGFTSTLTIDIDFIGNESLTNMVNFIDAMYGDAIADKTRHEDILEKVEVSVDIVDQQYRDYLSICGHSSSCSSVNGFNGRIVNTICTGLLDKPCSCEENCIENGTCCTEFILRHRPYSCYNDSNILQIKPDIESNTVTDILKEDDNKCYRLIDKCGSLSQINTPLNLTSKQLHILAAVPVKHGRVSFKNISYMMCNVKEHQDIHIDIKVKCDTYIEKSLVAGLDNLPNLVNITKHYCKTSFVGDEAKPGMPSYGGVDWEYENIKVDSINDSLIQQIAIPRSMLELKEISDVDKGPTEFTKCNQSGLWWNDDETVRSICESFNSLGAPLTEYRINGLKYKNYACYICNPEVDGADFADEDVISSCNVTGLAMDDRIPFEEKERLCSETEQQLRWLPFKNLYCSQCNLPTAFATTTMTRTFDQAAGIHISRNEPSYRSLFSLTQTDFVNLLSERTKPACENGTFDYVSEMCRPLYCRSGRVLRNDTCQPLLEAGESLFYSLNVKLTLKNKTTQSIDDTTTSCETEDLQRTARIDLVKVVSAFRKNVSDALVLNDPTTDFALTGCDISTDIHCLYPDWGSDKTVYLNMLEKIDLKCNLYVYKTQNRTIIESVLVKTLTDEYQTTTVDGNNVCLKGSPEDNSLSLPDFARYPKCHYAEMAILNFISQNFVVDRFFTCVQIRLDESEYEMNNDTGNLILTNTNIEIQREYYYLYGTEPRMCLKDYTLFTSKANNTDPDPVNELLTAYNIFSEVCTVLSMVCLFITFVTYCLFRSLRTIPGKNNMALCFCLFCAQGALQLGTRVEDNDQIPWCTVMGILIHYFWLATFFAMNICSFHMFRVFCSKALSVPSSSKRRFSKYLFYVFFVPFLIVSVTFTTFFVSSNGTFTGYGFSRCFLADKYGVIFAFIVPSATIFLANIIFFIIAFHKIRTSPRVQSSGDRREFFMYIKLCTVVGITWPLQIVDALLPLTIFSFVVVGLNASQGVFICFSYVFNRRVFFLYRKFCSKDTATLTSGTSLKTSSTELADRSNGPKSNTNGI